MHQLLFDGIFLTKESLLKIEFDAQDEITQTFALREERDTTKQLKYLENSPTPAG